MLSLPVSLTQEHAKACLDSLTDGLNTQEAQVVVDGAQLRDFDSSALAVLLALRRESARLGKRFAVQGLPERLRSLAALYGIERLLPGT
jgi:phospholipid transport system transporter-binding protein